MADCGWLNVSREHIIAACRKIKAEGVPRKRIGINTFLLFEENEYPAKYTRGLAYQIANGRSIKPDDYTGGKETADFLISRGFQVRYAPRANSFNTGTRGQGPVISRILDSVIQKNALQIKLQKLLGHIETEKKFEWMVSPSLSKSDVVYHRIVGSLLSLANVENFFKPNYQVRCDFFFEQNKLIIEYDERSHFSLARKKTLEAYPEEIKLCFPKQEWIDACSIIKAKDNNPPGRDLGRALFDSVRDIEAFRHGYYLLRIKHGDLDWTADDAMTHLIGILEKIGIYSTSATAKMEMKKIMPGKSEIAGKMIKASSSNGIVIARTILNLLNNQSALGKEKWLGHKRLIREKYLENPVAYANRLGKIMGMASSKGADVVLLPACALIYDHDYPVESYLKHMKRIPVVISGSLDLDSLDNEQQGNYKERLMIFINGDKIEECGKGKIPWFQHKNVSLMTAVSSTIKDIKEDRATPLDKLEPHQESAVVVLDAGHHQYSGRYLLTMESVKRHLERNRKCLAVILSYWRFRGGQSTSTWVKPNPKDNANMEYSRYRMSIEDEYENDYLDVIKI